MARPERRAGLAALLAVVLGGCGGAEPPTREVEPLDPPRVIPQPGAPEPGPIVLPPQALTDQVLDHAAELTGVGKAELEVLRSLGVTWRDGSLGCPQPELSYTMALVPGWHMIIRAGERVLDYRLSSRAFMHCTHPTDDGYAPEPRVTVEQ